MELPNKNNDVADKPNHASTGLFNLFTGVQRRTNYDIDSSHHQRSKPIKIDFIPDLNTLIPCPIQTRQIIINSLSDFEKKILRQYINGDCISEVAEQFNLSEITTSRIVKTIKLRFNIRQGINYYEALVLLLVVYRMPLSNPLLYKVKRWAWKNNGNESLIYKKVTEVATKRMLRKIEIRRAEMKAAESQRGF